MSEVQDHPAIDSTPGRRRWLYIPAATAGLLAATFILWRCFNAPPGSVGREFPSDLVFYYFPMLQQAAERMRAGELPLWNPWQCCGVPFLATAQVAIFYPPTWLILIMPVAWAVKTLMFGQVFVGGLFAAFFFRSLSNGRFAATIGGVLYLFGCMLGQTFWPSEVSTLVWLPFLMWAVERFIQTQRRRWWIAFTIGVALQALAGFPQFMVYTFYLLGPYALVRLIFQTRSNVRALAGAGIPSRTLPSRESFPAIPGSSSRHPYPTGNEGSSPIIAKPQAAVIATGRAIAMLGAGCILAVGVSAIQLAPTFELAHNTARMGRLDKNAVHYLEAERDKYLTLDRFFHNMFDPSSKMITFDFPDGSGYLGMMTPLLAGIGLLLGRRDYRVWFFAAVAAISFVLAFGYSDWSGWAYRLYAHLPTGDMFRTPSRFLLLTYFSLIVLAVFGLDGVAGGLRQLRGRSFLRLVVAGLAVAFLYAVQQLSGELAVRLAAGCVVLVVMAYLAGSRPVILNAVRGLLLVLLVFDLAKATAPYGSLRDIPVEWGQRPHWRGVSPISPDDVAVATAQAGLNRVSLPGLRPPKMIEPPLRFYSVNEYEPLLPERWHWANECMHGESGFIMCMVNPDRWAPFYDMASVSELFRTQMTDEVRRRLSLKQWEIHSRVPLRPPPGMQTTFEHRQTALPRAYTVGHYELIKPVDAIHRFLRADWDYRDGVLIEDWQPMPPLPPSIPGTLRQVADIVSYSPQRVVIRANAAGPRLLVLTDTFFPGWKALVDGVPTRIVRANYLFRAVPVPAGEHEVIFEYRPASFRAGAAISLVSIAALITVAILAFKSHRPHRLPRGRDHGR